MVALHLEDGSRLIIPLKYFDIYEIINIPKFKIIATYCPIIQNLAVYRYEKGEKYFYVTGKLYKGGLIFKDNKGNEFKQISGCPLLEKGNNYLKPHGYSITDRVLAQEKNDFYLYLKKFEENHTPYFYHGLRILTSFIFSSLYDFLANLLDFRMNQNNMVLAILNENEKVINWCWVEKTEIFPSKNPFYIKGDHVESIMVDPYRNQSNIFYRGNLSGLRLLGAL